MRPLLVVMLLALACERSSTPAPATPVVVAPGQPRRVDIRVSNQGYTPARIAGRAGETLTLAFHYEVSAGECGREVLVPGQPKLSLTADKVSEVAVRLPPKGELTFTCGMNMLTGTLIVQ